MSDPPKLNSRQLTVLASIRGAVKTPPVPVRACGDCTRCCEGWLSGSVFGHAFSPGTPCFFLEKTCSIYPDRPGDPCRIYQCAWLAEEIFPMWMKPNLASIIISKRHDDKSHLPYYAVDQAGDSFDQRALNWLIKWANEGNRNVEYRFNGDVRRVGSPEFVGP